MPVPREIKRDFFVPVPSPVPHEIERNTNDKNTDKAITKKVFFSFIAP